MADVEHLQSRITPEAYLAAEDAAEFKSEYVNGWLYGIAGATNRHTMIFGDLFGSLLSIVVRPCRVYGTDTKVRIRKAEEIFFYYPDASVSCAPFAPGDTFVDQQVLICEVLSPSTARLDRQEKFENYKMIDSLREYLLIDQNIPKVEVFRRSTGWQQEIYTRGHIVHLDSIDADLAISDLYARVVY